MRLLTTENRADPTPISLSRRCFVQGLAGGGLLAGLIPWRGGFGDLSAQSGVPRRALSGTHFELEIGELPVDFTGRRRVATVINGQLPGPLLRWRQGDTVTLCVRNRLTETTSLHWHGMVVPADMDGVPGLSFHGIPPGGEYLYRFAVNQSGTYWYHSHSGFQEQTGMYGAIVIEPRHGRRHSADRDYVVMLSDWTDELPAHLYDHLKN